MREGLTPRRGGAKVFITRKSPFFVVHADSALAKIDIVNYAERRD